MVFDESRMSQPTADEHERGSAIISQLDHGGQYTSCSVGHTLVWSPGEEAQIVRKIDFFLLFPLMIGYFLLQIDRTNIGNALTDNFLNDVSISQNQFNVGQQLLSVGIIIFEVPSNLVLYRTGPAIWIGGQIIAWGLVATFQAFQRGLGSFLATRFLLGACEAGFLPASLYILSRWYRTSEIGIRFALLFVSNYVSVATSGIIAYGILHMRGVAGLAGWQWLFILEGICTVAFGLYFLLSFPTELSSPISIARISPFSAREALILEERVIRDDPSKTEVAKHISWEEARSALTNWRLIPHLIISILGLAPSAAVGAYAPSLVNAFGFGRLRSNAMTSIGYWGLALVNILAGWAVDRLRARGPVMAFALMLALVFNIGNRVLVTSRDKNLRFAMLLLSISVSTPWHAINGSWLSLNARSAGERSITLAIYIMAANCNGIIGPQLFRAGDGPYYPKGFSYIVGFLAAAFVLSLVTILQYSLLNRRAMSRPGLKFHL
ncbi:alternative sulfate transporter [Colletotrichum incanum]|uniref:Alternative sulfate transporter n=1 Tax=Colletotrichum incanum TaxID=1573173 RepID=A0A166SJE8_COLIC|nr:alternative sulfate transporter [Colletotrichum incanum]